MNLVTLKEWGKLIYRDNPPSVSTLRRWARNGNIYPAPEKHGRSYRVIPDAFYINPRKTGLKLEQHTPNGRTGRGSELLERLRNEIEKIRF
ncbi:excisionase [Salmonella enterica]|uniref:excisionase n=1 Tax=Salmonella enterica TaxID=28901 RepID=UPI0005C4A86D|nr:excisionase [Salmonella enterica]EAB6122454.1 excisionase [Salmonella enterica subsp. enterica serovar Braenderup]EDC6225132.1 excisionase [Salmonella enterica subsp. enterica serovar Eastbourne]EDU9347269.1 excisionase [Salmonella enterica subsp. enterica]EEP8235314.1 excisionase [Salmonella enterica subsp. enterica serovar Chester]EHH3968167.1 excisionase [Salmonella enterica subsp. enterica serovar Hadar]